MTKDDLIGRRFMVQHVNAKRSSLVRFVNTQDVIIIARTEAFLLLILTFNLPNVRVIAHQELLVKSVNKQTVLSLNVCLVGSVFC